MLFEYLEKTLRQSPQAEVRIIAIAPQIHPHPEKTLLIYKIVGAETKDIRKMWKDAARGLNLPDVEGA